MATCKSAILSRDWRILLMWPRLPRCLFFAQDPGGPWLKFKERHAHRRGRGAAHGHVTDVVGRLRVVRRRAASRAGWLHPPRVGRATGRTREKKAFES